MPGIAGLYFEVLGPPGGTPVILSAGLGGIAEYWRPNLAALTERHRVILYDHRGTARSDRAIPENHSIGDMANDILAVLDGLGVERAHLIGHALGGLIGLCLALKAPERLISLVAVNAWAKLDPHTRGCFETRLLLLRNSGSDAFIKAHPLFLYPAPWISSHMAQLEMDVDHQRAAFPGHETTEARIKAVDAFDVSARLVEIKTPVLSIASEDDMLSPYTAARALADGLPCGRFALLPRGGHACNVTEPEPFNRIVLAWLNGDPGPERS
jgi:aminoacrylate hydrolase